MSRQDFKALLLLGFAAFALSNLKKTVEGASTPFAPTARFIYYQYKKHEPLKRWYEEIDPMRYFEPIMGGF